MRSRPERSWGALHPQLDLHGLTGDQAVRRVESWLHDQRGRGVVTVIIITGRGNRSPGPPVVRTEVEHHLAGLPELVRGCERTAGGGALLVQLAPMSRRAARPSSAPRVTEAEPELRARAEEELWELGITPTPALLAAAMRRLREAGED